AGCRCVKSCVLACGSFRGHEIEHNPSADESEASYRSCKDAPSNVSGRSFMLLNADTFPFEVYCEQISFGGGWIVFQHRFNGQLDFYKNWTEYSDGFGDLEGEFWLGLDYLHRITSLRPHELLVEVKDFAGNYGYALYDGFEIGSDEEQYVLKKLGKYQGTAGDSMSYNWGKKFSTADSNNGDYSDFGNCAADRQGAWWYVLCTRANLNGPYKKTSSSLSSMYWHFSTHDRRSLAYSRMMIREV
uniref:Fibrinogen C-terminal domain-containing protein n=1 Tax=Anopheles atroparvus TaxID=41427 RepID=A0AAG5DFS2_ANOAO